MHQLVILGNGFDMACGLESSFSAFHHSRFNAAGQFVGNRATIWDFVLKERYENGNPNWSDVESALCSLLIHERLSVKELAPYLTEMLKTNAIAGTSKRIPNQPRPSLDGPAPSDQKAVFDFLYEQLSIYEEELTEYLSNQVSIRCENYASEAHARLVVLMNDMAESHDGYSQNYPEERHQPVHTSILSFNYTRPIEYDTMGLQALAMLLVTYKNVHGELGKNNIVIGVDATKISGNPLAIPFTKTYRLLALDPVKGNSVLHTKHNYEDDSTQITKVFGHSLAPADYSYFQALFDEVNLYSSSVKLIFYYEPHGEGAKHEQEAKSRLEQYHAVTNLLNSYGQSFDNKDHGKNLMHKLLR